ncbi:MAG: redoxin domain-containing protein [Deltaproteobacteria bacterium]|nr:MAG: redoxin domain-containing protein [Deltaproteobacteria bacterium]
MIALLLSLAMAQQPEAELAVERAKAMLLEERSEQALEQAVIALDLDASAWEAHWVYLQACEATGLLPRCEGELTGLAVGDPMVSTVLTWYRVGRGEASPAALAELEGKDKQLTVLALAELALRDGRYPVVDVMLEDVHTPLGERLRIASLLDRGLDKEAAKAAKAAWTAFPEHPDSVAALFESRAGGPVKAARKKLEREARATADTTLDPVWLWRMRLSALSTGDAALIDHVDRNLERVGEQPGLDRLVWGAVMRKKFARTMTLSRDPELPEATPSETRDLAGHVAIAFRDMGRIPEALALYEQARKRADSPALATEHAVQLLRTRNYKEARDVAEEALAMALRPSAEDLGRLDNTAWASEVALAYATLATAESGLGNKERALDLVTTATLLAPEADWFALRAMLQQQEGFVDAAFTSWAIAHALGSPSLPQLDETWRGAGESLDAAMAIAEHWSTQPGRGTLNIATEVDPEAREQRTVPRLGRPFPEWETKVDDQPVNHVTTEGKVVVLAFWASWCGPCREELPAIDRIARRMSKDGLPVQFLAVSTDASERDYKRYVEKFPLDHVDVTRDEELARALGIRALPTLWVIGPDGRAKFKHLGYQPGSEARLETELRELATSE